MRGDWDNPYLTLKPEFEGIQIKVFGDMANKGYIYKGMKPVYWCADCETALAEAEIEYHDKVSPSIYVKFPVTEGKGIIPDRALSSSGPPLPGPCRPTLLYASIQSLLMWW